MTAHGTQQHKYRGAIGALLVAMILTLAAVSFGLATTQAQPSSQPAPPAAAPVVASTDPYIEYAPNTVLLKLKPGVALTLRRSPTNGATVAASASSLDNLLQGFGATTAEPVFADAAATSARTARPSRAGLERIYRIEWSAPVPVEQAVAALAADPAVEYAEPDYIARAARTPNDPEYASQWALPKINAPAAWDITTGNSDVIIAVIDSGVDTAHPDFAGRLWVNDDPINGVDDDLNGKVDDLNGWNIFADSNDLIDPNGHGSEVGGVAGAATDNGAGIAGMCWTCRLMFVNAMQPSFVANYSDVAAAVQYAASNGAQVINLSLGGYADSAMLRDAVREAATTAVIVGGAGNDDSRNPFYPAAYPDVLAVAATDNADQKAIFSNYGPWVDVSAPGKDIRTTTVGGYATSNGTSLAAPFVSGLAGLLKSQHPTWTPEQVRWQILNTTVNIDGLNPTRAGQLGNGRIDAGAALARAPQARAAVESYTLDGQANARPAPGQAFQLALNLRNLWLMGQNLQGTLSSSDPHVTVTDAAGAFGDISAGQVGSNSSDPFGVTVANNSPYNHSLTFTLNLNGAGGYSLAVPFTVQVRSAVETLSNTIYSQNTTWTSDKTYVLNGSVIVNTGVTLTIQPGTVVRVQPTRFIRVDGTLIAQGTAEQPIVFTSATEGSTWSGIRFTASAVDAQFDATGQYVGGSILRHTEVNHADVGLSLAGRAPYIADSVFADNAKSIQTWADGAVGGLVHIERSRFAGSGIDASGGATIVQNDFSGSGIALQGGSPLIMQNTFTGGGINGSVAYPAVVSNTVQEGGIGLNQSFGIFGAPAPLPPFLQNLQSIQVAAGDLHTCALLADGGIQCWGGNEFGELGNGGNTNTNMPQRVTGLAGLATKVAAGAWHTCALLADGGIQCWGGNDSGQLGNGGNTNANMPQSVTGLAGPATQVAGGRIHTCALLVDGGIQCWGANDSGQLGNGDNTNANMPQRVTGLAGPATQVASSWDHTCALLADGGIQCWGGNEYGELGNGGNTNANTPQLVTGLAGPVTQVATGDLHTCALLADGGIQCWGGNDSGQLGNGGNTNANMPQSVTGLAGLATKVAAGAWHTCALLADGGIQCWGGNGYGELGNGGNTNANMPQSVTGLAGPATQVASSSVHTCALLADGGIQCWGRNVYGQLGNGDNTNANTPQSVIQGAFQVIANVVQQGGLHVGASFGELQVISNLVQHGSGLSVNSGAVFHIHHNSVNANTTNGLALSCDTCWGEVVSNTITHNQGYGISLSGGGIAQVKVRNNNLVANGEYDLYLTGGQAGTQNFTVDAISNFWNIDASQIPNRIRDCTFDDNGCGTASSTVGKVAYNPPLAHPEQAAPAFMRGVTVDPNPVGMQQRGTVTVDFSATMMTSTLPTASFHDARLGTSQVMYEEEPGIRSMASDILGRMWFSLYYGGVRSYDGRNWITYTTDNSGILGGTIAAIYSSVNGDMWFGHSDGWGGLSRLQGTTWITYTVDNTGVQQIYSIGQDNQGAMWFGGDRSVYRYDGSSWLQFTAEVPGLVEAIVNDGQGRMWFQTRNGLSVYDGVKWTTHDRTTGLPPTLFWGRIVADRQGRIWAGLQWYQSNDRKGLAMYDGTEWQYFLEHGVQPIGEASDGTMWFASPGYLTFRDGLWSFPRLMPPVDMRYADEIMFDSRDNLWHLYRSDPSEVVVIWNGLDYAFTDGQWLSPTRFQAAYTFDANIWPSFYTVQADGAVGSDGINAFAGVSNTFQVDFGAGVTLDPPSPPQVTAQANGSLNHLVASWQNSSPNVDQYRYAIGTTPGARNVVGWTYLAGTSVTRTDLNLVQGQTYYVTVQARNTSGLWSVNGVSNGVVAGQAPVATATPTPTATATLTLGAPTATPTATPTLVPGAPTATPVAPDGESEIYLPAISRP